MIVANNSRVVNCKLTATATSTGSSVVVYLLHQLNDEGTIWEVSGDDGYETLSPGDQFVVDSTVGQRIDGVVMDSEGDDSPPRARFSVHSGIGDSVVTELRAAAQVPLPPYITETTGAESGGYQTVYAKEDGSVAAPTAGLHFTEGVLAGLEARGVQRQELTLHVGYGTFGHVRHEELSRHRMHSEVFTLDDEVAAAVNGHRRNGGKLLAVGTTSTRVLESCTGGDGLVAPRSGETDIFIHPGYRFKAVDALLTNFHMPKLTPIMLVAAFAG
jgi:S-adenosylmethionine:tRNA ribosyltransferase-isomerase